VKEFTAKAAKAAKEERKQKPNHEGHKGHEGKAKQELNRQDAKTPRKQE